MRSFTVTGKLVAAYTASPGRAFLVEIPCFRTSGILVPAGMVSLFTGGAGGAVSAGGAGEGGAAGVCCAKATVAQNRTNRMRLKNFITDSLSTQLAAFRILSEPGTLREVSRSF